MSGRRDSEAEAEPEFFSASRATGRGLSLWALVEVEYTV